MANNNTIIPFSVGDRVCYVGITRNARRFGRICDVKTLYGGGYYNYKIIFDGCSEPENIWYDHYNIMFADALPESKQEKTKQPKKSSRFCRKCGKQLADEAIYCPQCGTKVIVPTETRQSELNTKSINHGISSPTSENRLSTPLKPEKPTVPHNPVDEIETYDDFLKHYAKKG